MHILLTDILTCPRCGPRSGLIVLAERIESRRVLEGRLGCANCRSEYPVAGGVADLRRRGEGTPPEPLAGGEGERALRLAALSGARERPGPVLVRGAAPEVVSEMAGLLEGAQLFGASSAPPGGGVGERVSWVLDDGAWAVRDGALAAAAVVGPGGDAAVSEAARALAPGGRLVLDGASPETVRSLESAGWTILLEQAGVAVASRPPLR